MAEKLRLYSRAGCHLCDALQKELETLQRTSTGAFTLEVLDIDRDPETQRLYCLRVPVLTVLASGTILCETRFDRNTVLDYLAGTAD